MLTHAGGVATWIFDDYLCLYQTLHSIGFPLMHFYNIPPITNSIIIDFFLNL